MNQTMQSARSAPGLDVLRLPVLGHFLRWKHSRTAVQIVLFALAAAIILDGLLGSQLATKNVATTAAWVHYRGLVVLALLLAGNLFCAGCPFLLPRPLARWLGRPNQRWPRALRNKWLALAGLVGMLFAYELFDLWASPWLTAWVAVAYFTVAFVLEALFTQDSFCLYVCPLGTFNFLYSTVSPLRIGSRDRQTCRDCAGHECINGRQDGEGRVLQQGCQLELYVPTMQSNLDCTLCLDCVKACPYDNVTLAVRPPGDELLRRTWPHRLDLALLAILATFVGMVNAFAMTPPVYRLEQWLAARLHTRQEWIVLGLIFLAGSVLGPLALASLAAWSSRRLAGSDQGWREQILGYAYAFVPLGFAIWTAHYGFHFLLGYMTIVPAFQHFFANTLAWPLLGQSDWQLAARFIPPLAVVQAVQVMAVIAGFGGAAAVALRAAGRPQRRLGQVLPAALPWLALLLLIAAAAIYIFLLPMEMRGSVLGG
jgi:polyferredoxin